MGKHRAQIARVGIFRAQLVRRQLVPERSNVLLVMLLKYDEILELQCEISSHNSTMITKENAPTMAKSLM